MNNGTQNPSDRFLIRRDGASILFKPITESLNLRNMLTLDTIRHLKLVKGSMTLVEVEGILSVKHGEQTQSTQEFRAKTAEELFQQVTEWVSRTLYNLNGNAATG